MRVIWPGLPVVLFPFLVTPSVEGGTLDPTAPPFVRPEAVASSLDSLQLARRLLVHAAFHGDAPGMAVAAGIEDRHRDRLDVALKTHPEVLRLLPAPRRLDWLHAALRERRLDWSRDLVSRLRLPGEGAPSRGPFGLAFARNAFAVRDAERELHPGTGSDARWDSLGVVALRSAAGSAFLLRDEVFHLLGTRAWADGDTAEALVWADSLVQGESRSPRRLWAHEPRAARFLEEGRPEKALSEARKALPDGDTASLRMLMARAHLAGKDDRAAALELERVLGKFSPAPEALVAWELRQSLAERDTSFALTGTSRLQILVRLLANPEASALDDIAELAHDPDPELAEQAALALGRAFYHLRRYDEARVRLRTLTASADPDRRGEAHLVLARIARNTGRAETMTHHYGEVTAAGGKDAGRAAWEHAREYESLSEWDRADSLFTVLLDSFPEGGRAAEAAFRRGFVRMRSGRKEAAVEDFRTAFADARSAEDEERAAFWLARVLVDLGREEEASEAARAAASRGEPSDLYGVLARSRFDLASPDPARPEASPFDPREPLQVLADRGGFPEQVRWRFYRGLAHLDLGNPDRARAEWKLALEGRQTGRALVMALAVAAACHNLYPEGVFWAGRVEGLLPSGHPLRPGFRRLYFPPAYYGEVTRFAADHGLLPELVWALMRQESLYDPVAVSRAGALGLLQIMPATLQRITREAGRDPLPSEVLFRPQVNIELGTRFLADRLQEFEDRLLPALASYNAGERKSWQWIERADGDPEELFVETIGYPETYGYVRRIPWLMWVYRQYYPSSEPGGSDGLKAR